MVYSKQVQTLGQKYLLEYEMATHSYILVWKIPWTEKPGRLQSIVAQRVRHDSARMHACAHALHFSSVIQSCPTLCNPMDCSMPGFPVHHQLPELTQIHIPQVSDAIQTSHPLLSPSLPAFNLGQPQGFFQWVRFSYQVATILEFQLQHQPFQWIFRTNFL